MEFDQRNPIYIQIVNWVRDKIIKRDWLENERIPSVREIATVLQVNPNTAMRAYENLQNEDIIFNKRGIGYFVSIGAWDKITTREREEFISAALPELFTRMELLGITKEELIDQYEKHKTLK